MAIGRVEDCGSWALNNIAAPACNAFVEETWAPLQSACNGASRALGDKDILPALPVAPVECWEQPIPDRAQL